MNNEIKEILSLENIKLLLMKGFNETLCKKKIVIEGVFNNFENKMLLNDNFGNSIGLFYSTKMKERTYIFPNDGDIVTIEGYLNFGHHGEPDIIEKGNLSFWFNIENILEIRESKSSKLQKLRKIISRKEKRKSELEYFLKYSIKSEKKAKIIIFCSQTAEGDIKRGLEGESQFYEITYRNVPLSRDSDADKLILAILEVLNEGYDVIGFSRGGNENYDIFYNERVIEKIVCANEFTIAGIGHTNLSCEFLDAFDHHIETPIALGNYLKEISIEVKSEKIKEQEKKEIKMAQERIEKKYITIIVIIVILSLLCLFLF